MEPFTAEQPKPLLPILDRPVIAHQIEHMKGLGIGRVIVVVGHHGAPLASALGDGRGLGVELSYVEQLEPLGIAHALRAAERHVTGRFLLTLGDVFFVPTDLAAMVRTMDEGELAGVLVPCTAASSTSEAAAARR